MNSYNYLGRDIKDSNVERKSFQDWSKKGGSIIYNIDTLIRKDPYIFEKLYTLDEYKALVEGGG